MPITTHPLITVITVSLNNRSGLEKTIRSVIAQRNVSLEFIVVDGGSEDGTGEMIRGYRDRISSYTSGPDQGPYDGMNKGIQLATGDWVIFMNAGDIFFQPETLSGISNTLASGDVDAVYGDSLADYGDFRIYRKAGPFPEIWKGMVFSHQALLMRTRLLKENLFNTDFPKIADYDLILRCLPDPSRVKYLPVPLAVCDAYGISNRRQSAILRQYYRRARQSFAMHAGRRAYYLRQYMYLSLIDAMKSLLPGKIFNLLVKTARRGSINNITVTST